MKYLNILLLVVLLITLLVIVSTKSYDRGYDEGRKVGQREAPLNILEISSIDITKENGLYRFTITSGNSTYSIVELNE